MLLNFSKEIYNGELTCTFKAQEIQMKLNIPPLKL